MPGLKFYLDGQWWDVGGLNLSWIYVGTDGVDGIDTILAANPAPYDTGDTPGNIPFDNGTTAPSNPLAFAKFDTALFFSGGHTGQTTGQSIFTLPVGFRPLSDQPIHYLMSDFSAFLAANVQTDGQVIYEGSAAVTFT